MADQLKMLQEISEVSFTVNDLTLYLDTHPLDTNALDAFKQAMDQRKNLMQAYAREFEPLTINCVCPDTNNESGSNTKYSGQKHFTWVDGPLPWEGGVY
ncbi:MAG: spore coat protein CotJB [Lachnospiraceae bacterium]